MRVHLVTSDREKCGISAYGKQLSEALATVAPDIHLTEAPMDPAAPENRALFTQPDPPPDIVHLNHQGALLSQWKPAYLSELHHAGIPTVVTLHDTYERRSIMRERGLPTFYGIADAIIIHEPVEGLSGLPTVHYIRQGIPPLPIPFQQQPERNPNWAHVLGTVGFDLGQKNYDGLVEAAHEAGWGVLMFAPDITPARVEALTAIHPKGLQIIPTWLPKEAVIKALHLKCSATGFLYVSGGSGTSGAIRMGLAARRPLVSLRSRQNRDLLDEQAIAWCSSKDDVVEQLHDWASDPKKRIEETGWVRDLAERDSWVEVAQKYAAIYRSLAR